MRFGWVFAFALSTLAFATEDRIDPSKCDLFYELSGNTVQINSAQPSFWHLAGPEIVEAISERRRAWQEIEEVFRGTDHESFLRNGIRQEVDFLKEAAAMFDFSVADQSLEPMIQKAVPKPGLLNSSLGSDKILTQLQILFFLTRGPRLL